MPARHRSLDILRGLAVLLTLLHHTVGTARLGGVGGWAVQQVVRVGWIGVDLFFVLSGFLVGGLLFAEWSRQGQLRLGRFYTRRAFKIYPPYLVLLGVVIAGHLLGGKGEPGFWRLVAIQLAYLQNYLPAMFGHTWSLAVEEHFYLVLPVLLLVLAARRPGPDPFRSLLWLVPVAGLLTLAGRCAVAFPRLPADMGDLMSPTHLRIDSLLWGVLLGYGYHLRREALAAWVTRRRALVVVATAVLLAPNLWLAFYNSRFMCTFGLTTNGLGFALLIALTLFPPQTAPATGGALASGALAGDALAKLGVVSYSVYLWHLFVVTMWQRVAPRLLGEWQVSAGSIVLFNAIYLLLAIGVGWGLSLLVESPCLRLRNRLYPSRSGAVVAPEASATARSPRSLALAATLPN